MIIINWSLFGSLFFHYKDIVEVPLVLTLTGHNRTRRDGRLRNFVNERNPVELGLLEVALPLVWEPVGDANINA